MIRTAVTGRVSNYPSVVLAAWSLLAGACTSVPSAEVRAGEPIILTLQAPKSDFGKYRTFFLKPQIPSFTDQGQDTIDQSTAQPFLDATRNNLIARGYREADRQTDADLAVEMMFAKNVSSSVWCYSWYDPYYWGYPAWSYYPYYGSCDTTVWRSGLLATIIVDLTPARVSPGGNQVKAAIAGDASSLPGIDSGTTAPSSSQVPGVWFSGVYGVELAAQTTLAGIDQAFAQSPYLVSSSPSAGGGAR